MVSLSSGWYGISRTALDLISSYLSGLILVTLYTTPPGSVISRHLYTDNTQIFISLSKTNAALLLSLGQQCIQDVSDWIIATKLKFSLD